MSTKTIGSENVDEGVILGCGDSRSNISPLRFTMAEDFLWVFFLMSFFGFAWDVAWVSSLARAVSRNFYSVQYKPICKSVYCPSK